MKICIYEQLEDIASERSRAKKIEKLHLYSSLHLKAVLTYAYDPRIKWLLPKGPIQYKPSTDSENFLKHRLYQEVKRFRYFVEGGPYPNMLPAKRQNLFIDLLQSIHPKDAELILAIKDKKLPFSNITKEIVAEAFPILSKDWGVIKDEPETDG